MTDKPIYVNHNNIGEQYTYEANGKDCQGELYAVLENRIGYSNGTQKTVFVKVIDANGEDIHCTRLRQFALQKAVQVTGIENVIIIPQKIPAQ